MHINDLFVRIRDSLDELIALRDRVDDCQLQIAVHLNLASGDTLGFHIGLDQVAVLAALRAETDFEIYFETDDPNSEMCY